MLSGYYIEYDDPAGNHYKHAVHNTSISQSQDYDIEHCFSEVIYRYQHMTCEVDVEYHTEQQAYFAPYEGFMFNDQLFITTNVSYSYSMDGRSVKVHLKGQQLYDSAWELHESVFYEDKNA